MATYKAVFCVNQTILLTASLDEAKRKTRLRIEGPVSRVGRMNCLCVNKHTLTTMLTEKFRDQGDGLVHVRHESCVVAPRAPYSGQGIIE